MAKNKKMKQWLEQVRKELRKHSLSNESINKIIKDQHALINKEYQKNTSATDMAEQLDKLLAHSSEHLHAAPEPINAGTENEHVKKVDNASSTSVKSNKIENQVKQASITVPPKNASATSLGQSTHHGKQKFSIVTLLGGLLIGAVLGVGGAFLYSANGVTDTSQVVLKINNHNISSNELVKMANGQDYSGQLLNAYKMNVMAKALTDKYGTKEFKPTVDRQVEYIKKQAKGDISLAFQQYQVSSLPQLRQRLFFQLQLQKYINSTITDQDMKKAYQDYLPDQKFSYIGFADPKLAQSALKSLKKDGYRKFTKKNKKGLYEVTLNSANNGLRNGQFSKIGNLKVHDGGIAQAQSGQYLLLIKLQSAKKGSYDSVKSQLRTVVKQEKLADPNLSAKFIKDFKIESNSKVGDKIISAMKSSKSTR